MTTDTLMAAVERAKGNPAFTPSENAEEIARSCEFAADAHYGSATTAALLRGAAAALRASLAREKAMRGALTDMLEFVADDKFSEFAVEPCNYEDSERLCPKCESSGCITLKIEAARAALAVQP